LINERCNASIAKYSAKRGVFTLAGNYEHLLCK